MRWMVPVGCLAFIIAGCSNVEPAEKLPDDHWSRRPAAVPFMRIGRGVTNIVLSPLDIPATVWRAWREYDEFGYGAGLFQGIFNGTVRLGAGVCEAATFFLVFHPDPLYERDLGERVFRENYKTANVP